MTYWQPRIKQESPKIHLFQHLYSESDTTSVPVPNTSVISVSETKSQEQPIPVLTDSVSEDLSSYTKASVEYADNNCPNALPTQNMVSPISSSQPVLSPCYTSAPYNYTFLLPSQFNADPWVKRLTTSDDTGSDVAASISYGVYCKDVGKQAQERRQEDRDHHTFEHFEQNNLGQYQLVSENNSDGRIIDIVTSAQDLVMIHCSTNRAYTTSKTKRQVFCLYSKGQMYPITNKSGEYGEPTEYTLRKTLKLFDSGFRERRNHKQDDGENLLGILKKNKAELWLPFYYGWNFCPITNSWKYVTPGFNVFRDFLYPSTMKPSSNNGVSPLLAKDATLSSEELKAILLASLVRNRAIIGSMGYMIDTPLFFVLKSAGQAATLHELLFWGIKPDLSDLNLAEKPDDIIKKFKTEGDGITIHFDWTPGYRLNKLTFYCQQQMEAVATSHNHTVFPLIWGKTGVPQKHAANFIQVVLDVNSISRINSNDIHTLVPLENELSLVFDRAEAYISEAEHSTYGQSLIAAASCCYPRLKKVDRLDIFQALLSTAIDLEKSHFEST